MKKEKPFLTVSTQIYKLREQGLWVSNTDSTKNILRTHSYYTFVNGYCDLLIKTRSPRVFKEGASFGELLAIYNFDASLRKLLFPELLFIEDKIKATCVNVYCGTKSGNDFAYKLDDYLNLNSYDTTTESKKDDAKHLIKKFRRAIKSNLDSGNPAFIHSNEEYGYIPFWILTTNLSFGQISKFYECLNYNIRGKIAYRYHLGERDLRTALKILNTARNVCAHSNRLYLAKIPYMFKSNIGLYKWETTIDYRCNHRFGSLLYAMKFLLSESKFKVMIDQISDNLKILNSKIKTIKITDVLKRMGISPLMAKEFNIIVR